MASGRYDSEEWRGLAAAEDVIPLPAPSAVPQAGFVLVEFEG